MNGPFKMKPGQGKKQAFKEIPLSMKSPVCVTGDPVEEKTTEIVDRPVSSIEKSGDVFKGTTTKYTTTTPKRVIKTKEGDEAYAKLSPEAKKAQDEKFLKSQDVKTFEIKTTGLTKPKVSGPSADISKSLKGIQERVDPIERIEAFEQRSGTRGHLGVDVDRDFSGTGKYYNRPLKAGLHFVDRAAKGFGGAMGYEVRGVRRSGKKVDLGLRKNVESFGEFLKSKKQTKD